MKVTDIKNDFRALTVDKTDDYYTIVIQYHKKSPIKHWVTIRTIEGNDYAYLKNCVEEIIDALTMDI